MSEPTSLIIAWEDDVGYRVTIGDINTVASLQANSDYGTPYDGDVKVYAIDSHGEPKPIRWGVKTSPWDADDYSDRLVIVTFPDGHTEDASYRVDGRA